MKYKSELYEFCVSEIDADFFEKRFNQIPESDGYEYSDNFRLALKGDGVSEKLYHEAAENSCCGYYDDEVVAPSGKVYLFGFNYGH